MCKTKIFAEIINAVSVETEIPKEKILSSSKLSEVVDARSIAIKLLYERGFYTKQISEFMNRSYESIRYLNNHFDDRKASCKLIGNYLQNVRKQLTDN